MADLTITPEHIYEQIRDLSQERLHELQRYIEFLHFKPDAEKAKSILEKPTRIIHLEGILEGYEFSPEEIAEARREMWRAYYELDKEGIAVHE